MHFTYFGDLLGMAAAYRLSAKAAYRTLDTFYNEAFHRLSLLCGERSTQVTMFSDSLLVWGDTFKEALPILGEVRDTLLAKGILLRGGMVSGRLEFEPRYTMENFRKMLPRDDVLARAVGLHATQKGARLLIESSLVEELLQDHPWWLVPEGQLFEAPDDTPPAGIARRIVPTRDRRSYELLVGADVARRDLGRSMKRLRQYTSNEHWDHWRETIALLERSRDSAMEGHGERGA